MTTDEQKAAQEKLAARIAELKTYEGKTFIKKGSDGKTTFKVLKYEGVAKSPDGTQFHSFKVEMPGCIFTSPATQFINDHEQIEAMKQTATKEII